MFDSLYFGYFERLSRIQNLYPDIKNLNDCNSGFPDFKELPKYLTHIQNLDVIFVGCNRCVFCLGRKCFSLFLKTFLFLLHFFF